MAGIEPYYNDPNCKEMIPLLTYDELRESMEASLFDVAMEEKTNDELYEESSNDPLFYGLPHTKQYPMPDKKHVLSAIRFFNYVTSEDEEELARNINKQIKHFKMSDVNVGDGNRFKKYFKPYVASANESAVEKQYMFGVQMKKARELWSAVSDAAQKSLKKHCKDSDTICNFAFFKFSRSWDAHGFDVRRDLEDGLLNMTIFKIDIEEYVAYYSGRDPKTSKWDNSNAVRNRAIKALKNLMDKVTRDIRADKTIHKIQRTFNLGYRKYGDKTFIYCVEWSFKSERKHLATKMKWKTRTDTLKDFGKAMKDELKKPVKDDDDKAPSPYAGKKNVDIFGNEIEDYDDEEDEYAEDSVITGTAPIVPYGGTLTKRWR